MTIADSMGAAGSGDSDDYWWQLMVINGKQI